MKKTNLYSEYLKMNKIRLLDTLDKQADVLNLESKKAILHFMFVYDSLCDVVENY